MQLFLFDKSGGFPLPPTSMATKPTRPRKHDAMEQFPSSLLGRVEQHAPQNVNAVQQPPRRDVYSHTCARMHGHMYTHR